MAGYTETATSQSSTETSVGESVYEFWESKASNALMLYVSPILIILGTFGNTLSATVMLKQKSKGSMTAFYLIVLAVLDTLVLWTGLLRQWLIYLQGFDVRSVSSFSCKFHTFLVYWFFHIAVWVLVSVSLERFVGVYFPMKAKAIFTKKMSYVL